MHIILCRHTQTDHNKAGIYSGQEDVELNRTGRRQAAMLAKRISELEGPPIGAILSSDLKRTTTLAAMIGESVGVVPEFTRALREVNIGDMAGLNKDEAKQRFPGRHHDTTSADFNFCDIGGETARSVIDRHLGYLVPTRGTLASQGVKRIVVIGHGTALRLVFRDVIGIIQELHKQGDLQEFAW